MNVVPGLVGQHCSLCHTLNRSCVAALMMLVGDAGGPETSLLTDRLMAMDVTRNLDGRVHEGQRRF